MKRTRTPTPPLFNVGGRPLSHAWNWTVNLSVSSSGYVAHASVTGGTGPTDDRVYGIAHCAVSPGDDVMEVIECLAIESMLAACEPTLDGSVPRRLIDFTSNNR